MNQHSQENPHHFYANNYAEWITSDNLHEVIKYFTKQRNVKSPYTVWLVPGAKNSTYEIKWYAPQVEGAIVLGTYVKNKVWQPEQEKAA